MIINGEVRFESDIDEELIEIIDDYLDSDCGTIEGNIIEFHDHRPFFDTEDELNLFYEETKDYGNPIVFGNLWFDNTSNYDSFFKNVIWEGRLVFGDGKWTAEEDN